MTYQNEILILQEKNGALTLEIEKLKIINTKQEEVIINIHKILNATILC